MADLDLEERLRAESDAENSPIDTRSNSAAGGAANVKIRRKNYDATALRESTSTLLPQMKKPEVELAIETTSRRGSRGIFILWYATLLLALVLTSIISLQWQCSNICGSDDCNLGKLMNMDSSSCAISNGNVSNVFQKTPTYDEGEVVWYGQFSSFFDQALNRFVHVVFTMPRPNVSDVPYDKTLQFPMRFGVQITNSTDPAQDFTDFKYTVNMFCGGGETFCSTILLPATSTTISNASQVVLSAVQLTEAERDAVLSASIGAVYQTKGYTITTIALRYIFLVVTIIHFIRFLWHRKFQHAEGGLYEQTWIVILNLGLILYLNPLFAAGVYVSPPGQFLQFIEFRIPLFWVSTLMAFMFAVITSSMSWNHVNSSGGHSFHPPIWAKVSAIMFIVVIITLDIVEAAANDYNWGLEHCPNFECTPIGYTMYAILGAGIVANTVWLRWLRNNLGKKPYLSSRPQQLAVRLFIFLFTALVIYFIIQALVVLLWYRQVSSIVTYQSLLQVGPILVSFVFVQILTYAYTTTVRSKRVPFHPTDRRWKRVVWPTAWFQWISLHGGSQYIFFSEKEKDRFEDVQIQYLMNPDLYESQAESPNELKAVTYDDDPSTDSTDKNFAPDVPTCDFPAEETDKTFRRETSDDQEHSDESGTRSSIQMAARAAKSVGHTMEAFLVDRPAQLIDRLESRIINFADKLTGIASRHKPFLCLETAIDCMNLSWEAYGVSASVGDETVQTGINVPGMSILASIPILNRMCRCCYDYRAHEEAEDQIRSESVYESNRSSVALLRASSSNFNRTSFKSNRSATPPPTTAQDAITVKDDDEERLLGSTGRSEDLGASTVKNDSADLSATTRSSGGDGAPKAPPIDVEQYGHIQIAVFEGLDVQVVISERSSECRRHAGKPPRLLIAFRGTDNLSNAKKDMMIRRIHWPEMEATILESTMQNKPSVHVGFLSIWNTLCVRVMEVVRDKINPKEGNYEVVVTGHSLGGALAVLCSFVVAKYLKTLEPYNENVNTDVKCYTFGMPRVGNGSFRHAYEKMVPNTFRIVNESDAVSQMSIMGGSHVGIEVDIDRHGNFICEPMFIEKIFRPTKGKGNSIAAHSLNGYATSLNAMADCGLGWCPSRALIPYTNAEEKSHLEALTFDQAVTFVASPRQKDVDDIEVDVAPSEPLTVSDGAL